MKRVAAILCFLIVAAGIFWLFPLFHVVRLDELHASRQQAAFNAASFAKAFWNDRLVPSLDEAADAATVLAAYDDNRQSARDKFGRKVGVGRTTLFLLRGAGKVVNIDKKGVGIALSPEDAEPDIVLHTGLVFGNTVRDATGMLDASHFSNSQQFNEISTELNRIIETRVIPDLKDNAVPGREIQFAGCAEVSDAATNLRPLTVIPLEVSVK